MTEHNFSPQEYKINLYKHFARIGKALSNHVRLEILDLLIQSEHTVESLAQKTNLPIANVSQHLQVLKSAQVVCVRREGTYGHYRVINEHIVALWRHMTDFAEETMPEVQDMMASPPPTESINAETVLAGLSNGEYVLLDARPSDEYAAGHLPHAVSVPIDIIEDALTTLPKDRPIVVYCRNRYCLLADSVAEALKQRGYDVQVLSMGMLEWQTEQYPIELNRNQSE